MSNAGNFSDQDIDKMLLKKQKVQDKYKGKNVEPTRLKRVETVE